MDEVVVDPSITIKAIGHQWYPTYEYSDYNSFDEQSLPFGRYTIREDDRELDQSRLLEVDNRVVVYQPKLYLRVIVTHVDIPHSWAVPPSSVKCYVVPHKDSGQQPFTSISGFKGRSANTYYAVGEKKVLMEERRERIILFPLPLQGHVSPMIQLANILFSRGFSITVIQTSFNSLNPSAYPNFTFHEISDGMQGNQETSTGDLVKFLTVLYAKWEKPFEECLVKVLSEVEDDDRAVCLVTDALWFFTQAISTRLKIPRLVLRTSSVSAFLSMAAFPRLYQKGNLPATESEEEDPVPDLPPLRVKDLPTVKTENIDGLSHIFFAMVEETKKSAGLILNSCEELEPESLTKCSQLFGIPVFPIGPFHKQFSAASTSLLPQDHTAISWLNSQAPKSVLYISFGSIAITNQADFLEMASGLANSDQPFLWVVRPGSVHGSELLESLPKSVQEKLASKGYIVKWAPQQEVLAHPSVGGFWTHSGWNSSLESICEGVPMICSPSFGDQLVNARYVSDVWKIGLHLEKKLERDEIETSIRKLMDERESDHLRERIKVLKENVEICLRQGGSSCLSLEKLFNYLRSKSLSS